MARPKTFAKLKPAMTAEDFKGTLETTFGSVWRQCFSNATGYSRTQIHRYATGRDPIPQRVAITLALVRRIVNAGVPLPASWSPDKEPETWRS